MRKFVQSGAIGQSNGAFGPVPSTGRSLSFCRFPGLRLSFPDVLIHPSALRAAILSLLGADHIERSDHLVRVSMLTTGAEPNFVVFAAPTCAAFLALEMSPLIGRILRSDRSLWVLSKEEAERVVQAVGSADSQ